MSTERPNRARASGGGFLAVLVDALANRGFVACLTLLAALAIGFEVLAARKGIQFRKEPLNLKTPLDRLQKEKLAPYGLWRPGTLPPDMLDELGTEEYIQWEIDDPYRPDDGALRDLSNNPNWLTENWPWRISLFVTYYTGKPNQVPHVPEVCYAGSGHELVRQYFDTVVIPRAGGDKTIEVQVLEFRRQGGLLGPSERLVIYTFHANGQFRRARRAVQLAVSDPLSKYAYFSKLETSMDIGRGYASKDQALEAGKRLLRVVVPVLLEDHWPDWEAAVSGAGDRAETGEATGSEPGGG